MITLDRETVLEIAEAGRTIGADDLYVTEEDGGGYGAVLTTKDGTPKMAFKNKPASLKANWSRIDFPFIGKAASKPSLIDVGIDGQAVTARFDGAKASTVAEARGFIPDFGFDAFAALTYRKAPTLDAKSIMLGVSLDKTRPDSPDLNIHLTDKYAESTNGRMILRSNFEAQTAPTDVLISPELAKVVLAGAMYDVLSLPDKRTKLIHPVAVSVRLGNGWMCHFPQRQRAFADTAAVFERWAGRPVEATVDAAAARNLLNGLIIAPTIVTFKTGKAVFRRDMGEDVQEFDFAIDVKDKEFAFNVEHLGVFLTHCVCCKQGGFSIKEGEPDQHGAITPACFFTSPAGSGLMAGMRLVTR
ncbi:MAG: hypothetical protein FWH21_00920 [Kiritimatiellaeota bacterium]|nr:hypothetical protein [Kiritimatiellota bacterium]